MHCEYFSAASWNLGSAGPLPGPKEPPILSWQAVCAALIFASSTPRPLTRMFILPFASTFGSGMSMPCSRMHLANASARSCRSPPLLLADPPVPVVVVVPPMLATFAPAPSPPPQPATSSPAAATATQPIRIRCRI